MKVAHFPIILPSDVAHLDVSEYSYYIVSGRRPEGRLTGSAEVTVAVFP